MNNPEDFPNHDDLETAWTLAAEVVKGDLETVGEAGRIPLARLVLDTAWKIRGNRQRREEHERWTTENDRKEEVSP